MSEIPSISPVTGEPASGLPSPPAAEKKRIRYGLASLVLGGLSALTVFGCWLATPEASPPIPQFESRLQAVAYYFREFPQTCVFGCLAAGGVVAGLVGLRRKHGLRALAAIGLLLSGAMLVFALFAVALGLAITVFGW